MKNIAYYLCTFSLFILFISCNKDFEVFSPNGTAEETTIYLNEDSEVVDLESLSLFTSRDEVVSNLEQIKSDQIIFVYAGDTLGIATGLRNITFTGNSGSLKSKNDPVTFYSESVILNILEEELFISSFDKQFPNDMAVKFANNAEAYKVESEDMQVSVEKGTYKGSSYLIYNEKNGISRTKLSSDEKIIVRNTDYKALERFNKSIGETGFINCAVDETESVINSATRNNSSVTVTSSLIPYSRLVQGQFEVVIYKDTASLPSPINVWWHINVTQYTVADVTEGKVQVTPRIYPVLYDLTSHCPTPPVNSCWFGGVITAANIAKDENIDWFYDFNKASHASIREACFNCGYNGLAYAPGIYSVNIVGTRQGVLAHEIGHNLGAHHSNGYDDIMGSGYTYRHNDVGNINRIRQNIVNRLYSATFTSNVNLALGKPTLSSSSFGNTVSSGKAVDGNTDGHLPNGSVFHSGTDANEFWEVNLENEHNLKEIIVYNRTDCCSDRLSGAKVYASATPFTESNIGTLLSELDGSGVHLITLDGNASYQYIRITSNGTNALSLAEVEVYEETEVEESEVEEPATDNVALGKPTHSSSTINGGNSYRAVDGNADGNYGNNSVIHTNAGPNEFWEVDLVNTYNINEIIIYNRTDGLVDIADNLYNYSLHTIGAKVFVSKNPFSSTNQGVLVGTLNSDDEQPLSLADDNQLYRFVRIINNGTDPLSIAEVEVYGQEEKENLAIGKPTLSSATLWGGVSSRAVDGNTNGVWNQGSVTFINGGYNQFWEVDLERLYNVNEIIVYNRTDCCIYRLHNAQIYGSRTPFSNSNEGTLLGTLNSDDVQSFALDKIVYRYIRITNNTTEPMHLAEVEVYGQETYVSNIALDKPTNTSSSLGNNSPSAATDGNTDGHFPNGSVTHTDLWNDENEFWEVNLENHYDLNEIIVYNRTDCCSDRLNGAKVYASSSPFTESNTGTLLSELDASAIQSIDINSNAPYKYIRITSNGNDELSLAEVEIYGVRAKEPEVDKPLNLALGKPTNASSSIKYTNSAYATDGKTEGSFRFGSQLLITEDGANEFWEVNLENYYNLEEIKVYNRTDCCWDRLNGAKVYASATPFGGSITGTLLSELDGSATQSIHINSNAPYKYIRITSNGNDELSLAEVEVYGVETEEPETEEPIIENVALSKPTSATSSAYGASPSNATDGNTDGHFPNGSVTHTKGNGANQFWEVNLENYYNLEKIKVYNRTDDCCSDRLNGAKVYASSSPFSESNLGTLLYELDGRRNAQLIIINSNDPYKYIKITSNGTDALSLAEVEVYGIETEAPEPEEPPIENVALGKPTNASTSHDVTSPSNATDGITDGNFPNVTHTDEVNNENEFWEVNLENYYNLKEIKVYNRMDCCMDRLNGAKVYASASPFTESNLGTLLSELDGEAIQTITIDSNAPYKYIRINGNGTDALSLAEVEVYGIETEEPETEEPETEEPETEEPPVENVALGKPTNASSSHDVTSPSNATDGNTEGLFPNVTHTDEVNNANEFWEVNLENYYNLKEIKVYNRMDCCMDRLNGAKVYASASPFTESNLGTLLSELDGEAIQTITIDSNAPYKYIRITGNGTDALSLAEVEVYGIETEEPETEEPETEEPPIENVALGKPTNASSSSDDTSPSNATDGNTDGHFPNGSVTLTSGNGPNEFWEVNLENYYNLKEIKVYNRTDCCMYRLNNAKVYASASPFTESNLGTLLSVLDGSAIQSIAIDSNAPYKYIRIVNNRVNQLSLAEVEVFAY